MCIVISSYSYDKHISLWELDYFEARAIASQHSSPHVGLWLDVFEDSFVQGSRPLKHYYFYFGLEEEVVEGFANYPCQSTLPNTWSIRSLQIDFIGDRVLNVGRLFRWRFNSLTMEKFTPENLFMYHRART